MGKNSVDGATVASHIQMPKLLLKYFHNQYNQFCYYDVEKKCIGNKGTAKSINTQDGYYDLETEAYLEKEIETPFSRILNYLDKIELEDKSTIAIDADIVDIVLKFMYALVVRAPLLHEMLSKDDSVLLPLSAEERRDYIIRTGMKISKETKFLEGYILSFAFNKTDGSFVLSMDGIYNYTLNGHLVVNLPISPRIAISLIEESYADRIIHEDGSISMLEYNRPEDIMLIVDEFLKVFFEEQ